ncbi:hypothetical protein Fot_14474 [Forsythia ovata]|uniref:Uncharacterized protein n=1 Tax=Forsythia ovata TaxID=205694 RepID=A0ABD1W6V0_9LAMI
MILERKNEKLFIQKLVKEKDDQEDNFGSGTMLLVEKDSGDGYTRGRDLGTGRGLKCSAQIVIFNYRYDRNIIMNNSIEVVYDTIDVEKRLLELSKLRYAIWS